MLTYEQAGDVLDELVDELPGEIFKNLKRKEKVIMKNIEKNLSFCKFQKSKCPHHLFFKKYENCRVL